MMKFISILLILFSSTFYAQVVGTPYGVVTSNSFTLDLLTETPSFAFSTRKLKSTYNGFVMRVRNASNNAQADVYFDNNNELSTNSLVKYVVSGTSGSGVGTITTLSSFKGSASLFATIWYDQSGNNRNAIQATVANQPELLLNNQNNHATLLFDGTKNLPVTVAGTQILGTTAGGIQGIVGTIFFTSKINNAGNVKSFGFYDSNNVRFQMHLNWSTNDAFFDATEICCAPTRNFANGTSVGVWKQYTMQRQDLYKIGRVSGIQKMAGNGSAAQQPNSSYFGIGCANNETTGGHLGLYSEMILYKKALSTAQMQSIENSQMSFWNSY